MSFVAKLGSWLRALRHLSRTERAIELHAEALIQHTQALSALERSLERLDATAKTLATNAAVERLAHQQEQAAAAQALLATSKDEHAAALGRLDATLAGIAAKQAELAPLAARQVALDDAHQQLRNAHDRFVEAMREMRLAIPELALAAGGDPEEWLHRAFDETFRGTPDEIRERLSVYLPDILSAAKACGGAPLVDVGCGRGDWLDLLRARGIAAWGVDRNVQQAETSRGRGLDVRAGDGVETIEGLPAGSHCAVTVFHVVEHLTLTQQVRLLAAAHRALAPGGLVILETPNPENLTVGAWTFWMDPTHQKPVPPSLLRFLLEATGFEILELRRLHAEPADAARAEREGWPAGLRDLLCAPRDYSLLARRAAR